MPSPSESSIENELRTAIESFRAGNIGSAESRVDRLLKSHPGRADVRQAKGILLISRGEPVAGMVQLGESLKLDPNNAESLAWAALTSLNLRQFEEAEQFAQRLTEADPSSSRAHYLLANALRAQDRIAEAIEAIDRALELSPNDTDCLVTKARLLKEWQMPGLAVEFYRKALSIRPSPPAAFDLARILLNESHPREALDILDEIAQRMPVESQPHALIGQALTELHQFDEAQEHWQRAMRFSPDKAAVEQSRARAEIAAGRFEVAESLLSVGIERGTTPDIYFSILTTARKMTEADMPLIERMSAFRSSAGLDGYRLATLDTALGKSFDDTKDFQRAIACFDAANAVFYDIYPRRKAFNPSSAKAYIDFQIQYFNRERIERLKQSGIASRIPLFVVGMMRSGTTLAETIIGAHSLVEPVGEQSFWLDRVIELFDWSRDSYKFDDIQAMRFAGDYLKLVSPKHDNVRHSVDKNPGNVDLAAMLHCIYPNAKFVHMRRHPVDNLLSLWMTPVSGNVGYASNRSNMVFMYREYMRLISHLESVLPSDRFKTFQYETLTSTPDETIRTLLSFLNLEPEPLCFSPEQSTRTVLTPSVSQVRQPIGTGSQERWRNYEPWLGEFAELLD